MLDIQYLFFFILITSLIGALYVIPSLVYWLLLAELIWISIYLYCASQSVLFDALSFFIFGFFILCLATSESAIGLSLLIFNFVLTSNVHGVPQNILNTWNAYRFPLLTKL